MALFPKAQQGRRGGGGRGVVSSPSVPRKTTPRQNKQKGSSGRLSPRLQLTQKRTQSSARRGAGVGTRVASARQQTSRAKGGASATTGARRTGNTASRGRGGDGARAAAKKAAQADGAMKLVNGLKGELGTATETGMEELEAGCDAFVAAALDRCSSTMSGKEEEIETAEATLREMESREASITLPCSGMLKAIETNHVSLSAMVERCRATLDGMQQAESLKLKSSLNRATGVKS